MNNLNNLNLSKFLKKINTLDSTKSIVKEAISNILPLTEGVAGAIYILNGETNKIECFKSIFDKKYPQFQDKIQKITAVTLDLLSSNYEQEEAFDYMHSASKSDTIIEPFIYVNNIHGFIAIIGNDNDFYSKNIDNIQIISEIISSKLEILFLRNEAEQKEKYRVEFLASISHEFKTPLNSIIGFSDMLKYKITDNKNYRYLDNISKSSKFLLSLIQDVLDVSRAQSKKLELQFSTFSPKSVIQDIILGFDELKRDKNLEITYTLMDAEITADLKRFKQLIFNLISNAIKFNRPNGKIIIVSYLNENSDYTFEIQDTGDGISKSDSQRIFKFFTQVNTNRLKRQQGSGVGLALCKKIVEAHGGTINFKSRLNIGSRFWFTLPKKY